MKKGRNEGSESMLSMVFSFSFTGTHFSCFVLHLLWFFSNVLHNLIAMNHKKKDDERELERLNAKKNSSYLGWLRVRVRVMMIQD